MTVGYEFRSTLTIGDEILNKINKFLQGNPEAGALSRGSSNASAESLDAEEQAGVEEWQALAPTEVDEESKNPSYWINGTLIFPFGSMDYIVLVGNRQFAVLGRRPTEDCAVEIISMQTAQYSSEKPGEYISCCDVFGLGSSRTSETMDCLIIALGYSNGHVEFYTDKGTLLYHENFSVSKPIITISFDHYTVGQQLTIASTEEIFFVNGVSLLSVLSRAKSAIARKEKTAEELSEVLELSCERFVIEGKHEINHLLFTGIRRTTALERYIDASCDGVDARVETSISPNYFTVFASTSESLGCFVWCPEGSSGNVWTEAVSKIASTFIPHFGFRKFLGISSGSDKKTVLSASKGYGLVRSSFDDERVLTKLSRSPLARYLIAASDNLARVLLIDIKLGMITRKWKGYRDATTAWITSTRNSRRVAFLVIFAPRLSLLEVWLPYGDRVAAQRVDPRGVLLEDNGYAVLVSEPQESNENGRVYFMDSKGNVNEVVVPFLCALKQNNEGEAHDQILLEDISSKDDRVEKLVKAFSSLNTDEARIDTVLNLVVTANNDDSFEKTLREIREIPSTEAVQEVTAEISRLFELYKELLALYSSAEEAESSYDFPLATESEKLFELHLKIGSNTQHDEFNLQSLFSLIDFNGFPPTVIKQDLDCNDALPFARLLFLPFLKGAKPPSYFFETYLPKLELSLEKYAELLLMVVLNTSFPFQNYFGNFLELLEEFSRRIPEEFNSWEKMGLESRNINRCLIVYVALFIIKNRASSENRPDVSDSSLEWDTLDPVKELADSTLAAMHVCWILSKLKKDGSYRKMLQRGPGYVREQIATWAVEKELQVDNMNDIIEASEEIRELIHLLPKTTSHDLLCTDIAWELASLWFKNRENLEPLERSITFVHSIENNRLKHGLCKLVWDKFLVENMRNLSSLIEKNGRTPTDSEARGSLKISGECMLPFIETVISLLTIMSETVKDGAEREEFPVDHILQLACAHPPDFCKDKTITSVDSLAHTALKQSLVNYHLVLHHIQLYRIYQLQLLGNAHVVPKKLLFCDNGARAFNYPLDSHPLIPEEVDDQYMKNRHDFLTKVAEEGTDTERELARNLAAEWNLNDDNIAFMQLLNYLRIGEDERAKLELGSVLSDELGYRLSRISAARVIQLAEEQNKNLPTSINRFLRELADDEVVSWEGSWKDAVVSLADLVSFVPLEPKDVANFIKISTITRQYWGISFYNG
ncbi:unnamed protein product [Auanema sp. JU1783]|nr:unnamed protein product [Auanema sp. JU1783]